MGSMRSSIGNNRKEPPVVIDIDGIVEKIGIVLVIEQAVVSTCSVQSCPLQLVAVGGQRLYIAQIARACHSSCVLLRESCVRASERATSQTLTRTSPASAIMKRDTIEPGSRIIVTLSENYREQLVVLLHNAHCTFKSNE